MLACSTAIFYDFTRTAFLQVASLLLALATVGTHIVVIGAHNTNALFFILYLLGGVKYDVQFN